MSRVQISMALGNYDRHWPLFSGQVQADGIDLRVFPMTIEEIFWRQSQFREFDACEYAGAGYLVMKAKGVSPFTAIPVFPLRAFRQNAVYVNVHSGIERPEDLKGKRMAAPEYEMTAMCWIRDFLEKDYGVRPADMEWFTGGQQDTGRKPRVHFEAPPGVIIHPPDPNKTIDDMLERGEVDALMAARKPRPFVNGSPNVRRLIPNFGEVERDYYRRTGLFPIMHTLAIKNEVIEQYPWVPMNLYSALVRSRDIALEALRDNVSPSTTIPSAMAAMEEDLALMGPDYWAYGAEANRKTYGHLAKIVHEQGIAVREVPYEELFVPSAYDEFKI